MDRKQEEVKNHVQEEGQKASADTMKAPVKAGRE
mgnify:CR=1 FL=1